MKNFLATLGIIFVLALILVVFVETAALLYLTHNRAKPWGEQVAVINIYGEIVNSAPVIKQLHKYAGSSSVKAIVIRIDSPGGSMVAAQEIFEEISKIREKGEKCVLSSLGSVAASGGYYIACATQTIFANPATITGSIGVIINLLNAEELFDKLGIKFTTIGSGKHKDLGSPSREITPEEEAMLRALVNDMYGQFLQVVAESRGIPEEEVLKLADGRIFSGKQAKELNLIDELGNLEDTIEQAAKMAGIKGDPVVITEKPEIPWFLRLLFEKPRSSLFPLSYRDVDSVRPEAS